MTELSRTALDSRLLYDAATRKGRTMGKSKSRKCVSILLFCGWFVYAAANVGRMNYSASMVAIIESTGAQKDAAGLVASFFFFAYGAGQLVNGLLCKRYDSRIAVFSVLPVSAACNVAMTFCQTVDIMKYIWLVNGAAQSVLWSSLIRIQAEYLSDKEISKCIVLMSTTSVGGTFVAYGLSAFFVAACDWRYVFYAASVLLIAAAISWFFGIGYVKKNLGAEKFEKTDEAGVAQISPPSKRPLYVSLVFVAAFGIANGFVKDGITTWAPNLIKETFGLKTSFSIAIMLVLPFISFFGAFAARLIHRKLPNDITICGLLYAVAGVALALALLLYTKNVVLTVGLFSIVACAMAGINNTLVSAVPFVLRTVGPSGLYAGIIDAACYGGSMLASYLIGFVSDSAGWDGVILVILVLTAAVCALTLLFAVYWKRRTLPLVTGFRARCEAGDGAVLR